VESLGSGLAVRENWAMSDPAPDWAKHLDVDQFSALVRHGYDPHLPPRGTTGRPDEVIVGARGIRLRNRVCVLDGIEIDGHERSDLDRGSTSCIHCEYEGPNP
jgi:hypothetical protein